MGSGESAYTGTMQSLNLTTPRGKRKGEEEEEEGRTEQSIED